MARHTVTRMLARGVPRHAVDDGRVTSETPPRVTEHALGVLQDAIRDAEADFEGSAAQSSNAGDDLAAVVALGLGAAPGESPGAGQGPAPLAVVETHEIDDLGYSWTRSTTGNSARLTKAKLGDRCFTTPGRVEICLTAQSIATTCRSPAHLDVVLLLPQAAQIKQKRQ